MTELNEITDNLDRACLGTDPEVFFVEAPGRLGHIAAMNLCRSCCAQAPCRQYALERPNLHGVWGGTTAEERNLMRKYPDLAA